MSFNCCKAKKSKNNLRQTAEFLKIISDSNRLQILCMLNKGERCVCGIWQYLDLPQNLISHHLKVLKNFNLVESKKEGTKIIYSINQKEINKYSSLLAHYLTK
jgi:ArsR family transcriptional regulator, arsenate/arsenite/antimonite-responsive transcriptional repressor